MKAIRYFILFIHLLISQQYIYSQSGVWTWMNGDSTYNTWGVYGIKGVASPNNTPPCLYEACQWTDLQGNFWLFGGKGNTYPNCLWKYDPSTNEWTWVKGDTNNINTVYGVQGVPSINNTPGSTGYGANTWTDSIGDLWLFGGAKLNGMTNELWRYNIASNQWTWMKGSNLPNQASVSGTIGVAGPANTPSARYETDCSWVVGGDLWLFGGSGLGDGLWKFNIPTNEWTLVKGIDSNYIRSTHYGTIGIENPINTPGLRTVYCSWKDNCSNLWLFGGNNTNDVWKYNIITNNWAWESGSNIPLNSGIYNGFCNPSISSYPSSKVENRACWNDNCGNLWTFGGVDINILLYNDLWYFNSTTKDWTLVSGSTSPYQMGVYNIKTVPNPSNMPGGRAGAVSWKDQQGNLWLFGGAIGTNVTRNDLWRFTPDTNCPHISCQTYVCNNKSICRGDTTILTATGGQSYIWNTGETTSNIIVHPLNTTTYTVNINTPIGCTINRFITVFIKNPVINLGKDSILCIGETKLLNATCPNAVYSWQDGSTQPTYLAIKDTIYWVKVTDTTNNCSSIALITLIECNKELIIPNIITPNGDGYNDYFVIKDSYVWKLSVQIYNRWGVKVYENDNYQNNWDGKLNGKNLADGVYYYIIKAKNKNDNKEKQYHGSLTILR